MTEQEKKKLQDRVKKAKAPYVGTWSPVLTPEQKAAQEQYIKDNNLPF